MPTSTPSVSEAFVSVAICLITEVCEVSNGGMIL
jgi:hypothetical protein